VFLAVTVVARPFTYFFSLPILLKLKDMFDVKSEALQEISEAANVQLENATKYAQMRLKYAFSRQRQLYLDFDIKEPRICAKNDKEEMYLVVNLGSIKLSSNLVSKQQALAALKSGCATKGSVECFYDTYDAKLSRFCALLSPSSDDWINAVF